jgi:Protein of unknown function (DUF3309)
MQSHHLDSHPGEAPVDWRLIALILLILILIGVLPIYPHSRGWGYIPGGLVGVLVIILIVMLLL